MNNFNQSRRPSGVRWSTPSRVPTSKFSNQNLNFKISRNSKQLSSNGIVQYGKNRQLLSIPQHSRTLKMRRYFRVLLTVPVAGGTLSEINVLNGIRQELGLSATGFDTTVELFGMRIYRLSSNSAASLQARVLDPASEKTIAVLSDYTSVSGVSSLMFLYPVNSRPQFTDGTTNDLLAFAATTGTGAQPYNLIIDVDASIINIPTAS